MTELIVSETVSASIIRMCLPVMNMERVSEPSDWNSASTDKNIHPSPFKKKDFNERLYKLSHNSLQRKHLYAVYNFNYRGPFFHES